jgi:hypothetical protein
MSSLWQDVQALKSAMRWLCEDHEVLQAELVRQREDRLLDAIEIEKLRTTMQHVRAELAEVRESLQAFLEDEEERG